MLQRLLIENYALIDHLDIEFPGELVIITGETGAGKSILLGALSLVLGGRSDQSVLLDRSRNCVVEAVFDDDGKETIIRRVVTPQGRSRGFIDDEPAGVELLRSTAARLIDIHAQHQQLLLAERDYPRTALDTFAGITPKVAAHAALYQEYLEAKQELEALDRKIAEAGKERDYLEFQFRQLDEAQLRAGELESLEEEQKLLANSEMLSGLFAQADQLFEVDGYPVEARIKELSSVSSKIAPFYQEFSQIVDRLDSVRIEIKDLREEIASRGEKIVFSPERLSEVDERLALLYDLMRKFGETGVEGLIAQKDKISERLGLTVDAELERSALQRRIEALRTDCEASAAAIRKARAAAIPGFVGNLTSQIRSLELPQARFDVQMQELPSFGPSGSDSVQFLFDANGHALQPLAKCASGGELSRVMLCIKSLLASHMEMPTLIFDEIDSGVSGSIAEKMGRLIVEMGGRMQVFAITHLPQVASKGKAHFLVYKEKGPDGSLRSRIRKIDGDDRVGEIARMLSGEQVTPEAVANARVLLQSGTNNQK